MKNENRFQSQLIKELKERFEGCVILKNDPNYIQGIPDLVIFYYSQWAALECKKHSKASHRPNQEYWVNKLDDMGYARFIFPENKDEVLDELEQYFKSII